MSQFVGLPTPMVFQAETTVQFLAKCPACGDRHPLAYHPPVTTGACQRCGASRTALPDPIFVPAAVIDWRMQFGNVFSRIGKALYRLARSM